MFGHDYWSDHRSYNDLSEFACKKSYTDNQEISATQKRLEDNDQS